MPRGIQRRHRMTDAEMKAWLETQYDLNENGCWVWKQYKNHEGYGQVSWKNNVITVHRLYWILCGGYIPEGLVMCHGEGCSKACFNINHLRPDTDFENSLDKHRDGTMPHKLTTTQVLEIRERTDKKYIELAKEYGISRTTISEIKSGKGWKWL